MNQEATELTILIKGAGEIASGVAHTLFCSHFQICLTEIPYPQAVSRGVSFCEAVYEGEKEVEGVVAKLITLPEQVFEVWAESKIPLIIDPQASIKNFLHPDVLIDAIMAKRNLGTRITDAPLVIGLGPGFQAGRDVHVVVETNHSDNLGKVIIQGRAEKDTGIPINIGGFTLKRVFHAPVDGRFYPLKDIGESVCAGETVAVIEEQPIKAEVDGMLRAMLREGVEVKRGTKLGEIDPTNKEKEDCFIIRSKIRKITAGVLKAILTRAENGRYF